MHPRTRRRLVALSVAAGVAGAVIGGVAATSDGDGARPGEAGVSLPELDDILAVPTAGWATDFTKHTVPLVEFQSGGPGKDGIPAIDEPAFVAAGEADDWVEDREPVILLELGDETRAYPIQILIWHEIVNDVVAGVPVAVTFCPLCNTALVFERTLEGRVLDFGTTGNLRNSDLVMYDRQTESWWQQFGVEAVVGELAGARLVQVHATIVAWERVAAEHPDALVLSRETGFSRPYGANPYVGYDDVDSPPFFGAANLGDERLPPKERVVFVERAGKAVVVPFSALAEAGRIAVEVGNERLEAIWVEGVSSSLDEGSIADGREVGSADVVDASTGERVPFDTPFWFAVAAFRPDVVVVGG